MAGKKSTTNDRKPITRESLRKIWREVGTDNWLSLLNNYAPEHNAQVVGPGVIKCRCLLPTHADTNPSFFIHVNRGMAKCYGATCQHYVSDPLDLASLIFKCDPTEALNVLKERYSLPSITKGAAVDLEARRLNQQAKKAIYLAAHTLMCDALNDPSKHPAEQPAIEWLTKSRGISPDVLHALPVGILPSYQKLGELLENHYAKDLKRFQTTPLYPGEPAPSNSVTSACTYLKQVYDSGTYNSSIVWPLYANPHEISRIKVRVPTTDNKTFYVIPDAYEDTLGLYGLGWDLYDSLLNNASGETWVYVTEGEMDVMSYMAKVVERNCTPKITLVSAGGMGGAGHIENVLESTRTKGVFLIGDSPNKEGTEGGDALVKLWSKNIRDLKVKVFIGWDKLTPSLDLDAAVHYNGLETVENLLSDSTGLHFQMLWDWAVEKADRCLGKIDPKDKRTLIDTAVNEGKYLRNKTDAELYVNAIQTRYDVPAGLLSRGLASTEDTEMGFILRCVDALGEILVPYGTEITGGARALVCYNKKTQSVQNIILDSDRSIVQEMASVVGIPLNFVEEHIGFPSFMTHPSEDNTATVSSVEKKLRDYLRSAILLMAQGCPDIDYAPRLSEGYHHRERHGKICEYVKCSKEIFKITRDEENNTTYSLLDRPTDSGFIFDVKSEEPSWFPGGLTLDILNRNKDVDLRALYDNLVELFDVGFRFKRHNIVTQLLACHLLMWPIMTAVPYQSLMFVTGPSSSGKSYLTTVLGGIHKMFKIQLNYLSWASGNYSAAGIFQHMDGDTRLLALDEFESDDIVFARTVSTVLKHYRGAMGGEVTRTIGTASGKSRTQSHKHPVLYCAISSFEREQDRNRVLKIEMDQIRTKDAPDAVLIRHFGEKRLREMAEQISTTMFPRVPELLEHYNEVKKSYESLAAKLSYHITNRTAATVYSCLALMRYLGLDWEKFFVDFAESYSDILQENATRSESTDLLNAIIRANYIRLEGSNAAPTCIASLLLNSDMRDCINTAGIGVYFDEKTSCLLLLLDQMKHTLLQRTKYAMLTSGQLRDALNRTSGIVDLDYIKTSGILPRASKYLGTKLPLNDIVAIRVIENMDPEYLEYSEDTEDDLDEPSVTPGVMASI